MLLCDIPSYTSFSLTVNGLLKLLSLINISAQALKKLNQRKEFEIRKPDINGIFKEKEKSARRKTYIFNLCVSERKI